MRFLTSISILLITLFSCFGQNTSKKEYFMIYDTKATSTFQFGNMSFSEVFYGKERIGKFDYSMRIRLYSSGEVDTAYYRMDNENFYHYNKKILAESIVIPRNPLLNQKWFESDSSWVYTVLKTGEIFNTPTKKYQDCVLIECKQLTNRDKNKNLKYYSYFSKGNGYVGDISSNGQTVGYLKEVIKIIKENVKTDERNNNKDENILFGKYYEIENYGIKAPFASAPTVSKRDDEKIAILEYQFAPIYPNRDSIFFYSVAVNKIKVDSPFPNSDAEIDYMSSMMGITIEKMMNGRILIEEKGIFKNRYCVNQRAEVYLAQINENVYVTSVYFFYNGNTVRLYTMSQVNETNDDRIQAFFDSIQLK